MLVGPVAIGKNKFVLTAPPPDPSKIPEEVRHARAFSRTLACLSESARVTGSLRGHSASHHLLLPRPGVHPYRLLC